MGERVGISETGGNELATCTGSQAWQWDSHLIDKEGD